METSMTPNDFLKIIIQQKEKSIEPVPDGWYSCEELSKQWNCSKTQVHRNLKQGIKLGIVERKNFLVKNIGIRSIPHYYFKSFKKEKLTNKNN
jgi:predicted transcriptional regulator